MQLLSHSRFLWNAAFFLTVLVYAVGLPVTPMEPDAANYAIVSMEMFDSGNFLEIHHKGDDWLDKPHFQFWITALSYSVIGVNAIAYKLPAVLFTLLAALYTYLFGCRFYSRMHGYLAVLMLLTAQHIITSCMDVRAEPYMTGLTIMALYHFAVYLIRKKFIHLLAGSIALGCLIMTKGIFTVIPVAAGIGGALLYQLRWREIFHWQWLLVIAMIAFFIAPALYGHYIQFDMHPEKKIHGQQGVSGVEYFLWSSQWGRFSNTGPYKGFSDPFFFFTTILWAFAPWAILAYFALAQKTKQLFRRTHAGEHYTYFGFVIMFLGFSVSQFQLAHYLNPVFPFLAILTTASILSSLKSRRLMRVFTGIQMFHCLLLLAAGILLHYYFSGGWPHADTVLVCTSAVFFILFLFSRKGQNLKKIIFAPAIMILALNYYLNRDFYPALLQYQSRTEVAYFIREQKIPVEKFISLNTDLLYADMILRKNIPYYNHLERKLEPEVLPGKYIYTNGAGLALLDSLGIKYQQLKIFSDFHITQLTPEFINRATRDNELEKRYLVKTEFPSPLP
jgi:4-amino-4-deoxy-L-arabinose transferase-like glycosyltransferase